MRADKARKITEKAKTKMPLKETTLMILIKKIIDGFKLMIIYSKIRNAAHNNENVINVRKMSPTLKDKLEKNDYLVTSHRFDNGFYIRW